VVPTVKITEYSRSQHLNLMNQIKPTEDDKQKRQVKEDQSKVSKPDDSSKNAEDRTSVDVV
jgi:hypothetical protein